MKDVSAACAANPRLLRYVQLVRIASSAEELKRVVETPNGTYETRGKRERVNEKLDAVLEALERREDGCWGWTAASSEFS